MPLVILSLSLQRQLFFWLITYIHFYTESILAYWYKGEKFSERLNIVLLGRVYYQLRNLPHNNLW